MADTVPSPVRCCATAQCEVISQVRRLGTYCNSLGILQRGASKTCWKRLNEERLGPAEALTDPTKPARSRPEALSEPIRFCLEQVRAWGQREASTKLWRSK